MRSSRVDVALDPDLDRVAEVAYGVAEKLRDHDLARLHRELVNLCRLHPAKAAQVITCLAAWLDVDATTGQLWARCEAITASRTQEAP